MMRSLYLSAHRTAKVNSIEPIPIQTDQRRRVPLGITALLALGILDNIEEQGKIKSLLEMEHNSAEYLHVLIESLRSVGPLFTNQTVLTSASGLHSLVRAGLKKRY